MERTIISQRVREAILDLSDSDLALTEDMNVRDSLASGVTVFLLRQRLAQECNLSDRQDLIEIGKTTTIGGLIDTLVTLMEKDEC
jgi:hypothetical protein